jgi:hypothetical protein
MAIAIYVNPASLNAAQYNEIIGRLDAAGAGKPAGNASAFRVNRLKAGSVLSRAA